LGQVREWGIVLGYVFHDNHKPAINFIDGVEFWCKTKLEWGTMAILRVALTELDVQVFIQLLIKVGEKDPLFLDNSVICKIALLTINQEEVVEGKISSRPQLIGKDSGIEFKKILQRYAQRGN
jgi:hypothetical protein